MEPPRESLNKRPSGAAGARPRSLPFLPAVLAGRNGSGACDGPLTEPPGCRGPVLALLADPPRYPPQRGSWTNAHAGDSDCRHPGLPWPSAPSARAVRGSDPRWVVSGDPTFDHPWLTVE